ncbi:MAG: glycosyltransferase [Thermotogae bacterium]|nr:glycosyltransferase [Thermotogota bacterium]
MEWESFIVIFYAGLLTFFAIVSLRYLFHIVAFFVLRDKWSLKRPTLRRYPKVCVQLPVFNEPFVVERVIRAAAKLKWPLDKLEIQVLDDSTDDTPHKVAKVVAELKKEGINISHIRRGSREGFKAGALAYGMSLSDADYFAIFDADFIPPQDFLLQTVPFLENDPKLAGVQTRWGFSNKDVSFLAKAQAYMLNLHFVLEQFVRSRLGLWLTFNGTAGVLKRIAVEWAGGWQTETLTEDSDLSIRLYNRGYRILYLPDVEVPSELPDSVLAFKAQQRRWAKGGAQVLKKHLRILLSGQWPLLWRVEAFMQTFGNIGYPLGLLLTFLLPPILYLKFKGLHPSLYLFMGAVAIFSLMTIWLAFWVANYKVSGGLKALMFLPLGLALVGGLAINNTHALLDGLIGNRGVFERTPKAGDGGVILTRGISRNLLLSKSEVIYALYLLGVVLLSSFLNQMILALSLATSTFGLLWLGTSAVLRIEEESLPDSVFEWEGSSLPYNLHP